MSHSYTALYIHAVFATKRREPTIDPPIRERLITYLGGIARAHDAALIAAAAQPEHVHLLLRMHPSTAVADLMRTIKSGTSAWMHTEHARPDFAWQSGYGAFAVSVSGLDAVRAYIDQQDEHHRTRSFKDEFIALLERHGVTYNPAYVFDE
jgi:putative transposase